jgi:hypothetical protein
MKRGLLIAILPFAIAGCKESDSAASCTSKAGRDAIIRLHNETDQMNRKMASSTEPDYPSSAHDIESWMVKKDEYSVTCEVL